MGRFSWEFLELIAETRPNLTAFLMGSQFLPESTKDRMEAILWGRFLNMPHRATPKLERSPCNWVY